MRSKYIAQIFENSADETSKLWVEGLMTDNAFSDSCPTLMYGGFFNDTFAGFSEVLI